LGRKEGRPLSNIALCGLCGITLIGDKDKGTPVYVCQKRPAQPGACGGVSVQAARLEARVSDEVIGFLNDKRRVEALFQRHSLDGPEMRVIDARYAELEDNKMALEEAAFVSIQVLADPRPVAGTMGSTSSSACIVPER